MNTILVVDDDAFMQEIYAVSLEGHYQTSFVPDGQAALVSIERGKPDLILLDVEMPGMNGYETCRRIRAAHARAVPIMFVSGRDRPEDRMQGYEAGGDDYLVKPFQPPELKAKIENLLRFAAQSKGLRAVAEDANRNAVSAMTYLGEMGTLLEAIRAINACRELALLAEAMVNGARQFGLSAAVRMQVGNRSITRGSGGELSPLIDSLLHAATGNERIVQRAASLCVTYEHAVLLIGNMPLETPDRCGRLRDLLATLVEAADVRARALTEQGAVSRAVLQRLSEQLEQVSAKRQECETLIGRGAAGLRQLCADLSLSAGQSSRIEQQLQLVLEPVRDALRAEAQAHQALRSTLAAS